MQYSQPHHNGCPVVFNNAPFYEKKQQPLQDPPGMRHQDCINMRGEACETQNEPYYDPCTEQHGNDPHDDARPGRDGACFRIAGMVYPAPHSINNLYNPSQALRNGTLYAELDKPMMHCTASENQGWHTPEQAIAFAAWELRLYLNTHPRDKQALKYLQQLHQQMDTNYATTFIPCTANGRVWDWIDDPWPWEYAANCDRRG